MPRGKPHLTKDAFNVFEDTDSSSSSTISSSSSDKGSNGVDLFGDGRPRPLGSGSDGLAPALQRYFKDKGSLPFADSCVFVRANGELRQDIAAEAEAEVVVPPPLPPPPQDIIRVALATPQANATTPTVAAAAATTASAMPPLQPGAVLTAVEVRDGAVAASSATAPPTVVSKVADGSSATSVDTEGPERPRVRKLDIETAAHVAGLRPIRGASAGTTSVDLLNTYSLPVQAVPASVTAHRHHHRRTRGVDAAGRPEMRRTVARPWKEVDRSASQEAAVPTAPRVALSSSSVTEPSVGSGSSSSGLGKLSPAKHAAKTPDRSLGDGSNRAGSSAGRQQQRDRKDADPIATETDVSGSITTTTTSDSLSSETAHWQQLELDRLAQLSPAETAAGVVPPLRAHVYIEEDNGRFLDHQVHAELQARRTAAAAAQQLQEERLQERLHGRRLPWSHGSRLYRDATAGGQDGGGRGGQPPRRPPHFWAMLGSRESDDPKTFRYDCLVVVQYCRRLNVFLSSLACGAAVLMLIAATLPSVSLRFTEADVLGLAGSQSGAAASALSASRLASGAGEGKDFAVGNLALLVLLVRLFDAPFFLFLFLVLTVTSLLPLVWGAADAHWRRLRRHHRAALSTFPQADWTAASVHGAAALDAGRVSSPGQSPSAGIDAGGASVMAVLAHRRVAFNKAYLRETIHALTEESRRRRHGDGGDADVVTLPPEPPHTSAQAATGSEYALSPSVAPHLNSHAFLLETQRHQQRREAREQERLFGPALMAAAGGEASLQPGRVSAAYAGTAYEENAMAASMTMRPSVFFPAYGGNSAGEDPMGLTSYLNATAVAPPSDVANRLGSSMTVTASHSGKPSISGVSRAAGSDSPTATIRPGQVTPPAPLMTANERAKQLQPYGATRGAVGLSADARLRFADSFLLEGGMLSASNALAIRLKALRRWLAVSCFGRQGLASRLDTVFQPRLWCLVVCLAMTVVELALLDARTSWELLQLLATTPTPATWNSAGGTAGYTFERQMEFPLSPGTAVGVASESVTGGEPWTPSAVRTTFTAVYAVRAALLLIVWLLDVFL